VGHAYPGKGPFSLLRLFEALREAPRVDIVLAHWGGGLFFYELMPEVKKACARVFYDTAASPYLYSPKVFRVALEILGKEKILLGTDYPLLSWERYVRHLDSAGVTAYERAAIMGGNAERLFRM